MRPQRTNSTSGRADARRRGTSYVLILGVSLILLVIGLAAAAVARVNSRSVAADVDWAEAQQLAFSAAEHALARIDGAPDWRGTFRDAQPACPLGRGSFQWQLVDDSDGDLTDDVEEPFTIRARGAVQQAAYELALRCYVMGQALPALSACLHADGQISVDKNARIDAAGGPLSTNDEFHTDHVSTRVQADVEAHSLSGKGRIEGTVTVPAPPKQMPHPRVFDIVQGMATRIATQTIYRQVLSPAANPWGVPNAGGVYFIDAPGAVVTIRDSRIWGTLAVRCRTLRLTEDLLLEGFRGDLPALLVQGDLELLFNGGTPGLREDAEGVNFNPPGTPFDGLSDTDREDRYDSEVRGLVHVRGNLLVGGAARIVGTILCEGVATVQNHPSLVHDPVLRQAPPIGYTFGEGWIYPEGWRQVVR